MGFSNDSSSVVLVVSLSSLFSVGFSSSTDGGVFGLVKRNQKGELDDCCCCTGCCGGGGGGGGIA
jgi:hypothetical protein